MADQQQPVGKQMTSETFDEEKELERLISISNTIIPELEKIKKLKDENTRLKKAFLVMTSVIFLDFLIDTVPACWADEVPALEQYSVNAE